MPALLAIEYGATLLAAAFLAAPLALVLPSWLGRRLAAQDMARDLDLMRALEPALAAMYTGARLGPEVSALLLYALGLPLLTWMVGALVQAGLSGGVLLTLYERRFSWRRFAWGAWRWFAPFLLLVVIFAVSVVILTLPFAAALFALDLARLGRAAWLVLAAAGAAYLLLAVVFDYARVQAVAGGTRNVLYALRRAAALMARRPAQTIGLYVLMAGLGLLIIVLYSAVVAPAIPFEWGLAGVAAQQVTIAARLWARLARLGGEMSLVRY